MFNSSGPLNQGQKDGFARCNPYRGFYGDIEWAEYLAGFDAGKTARADLDAEPVS